MLQHARLGTLVDSIWRRRPALVASALVVALLLSLRSVAADPPWRLRVPALPCDGPCIESPVVYPVGPVEYLRDTGFRGNAFVPFHAGAYLSWALRSAVRVSIDGRWEAAYPPALLTQHVEFFSALDDWASIRARFPTDVVVAERHEPVVEAMLAEGLWPLVYQDDGWAVFVRPGLTLPISDRRGERFEGDFP
jgi:hypothetical protein